jgi:hypothetical protein
VSLYYKVICPFFNVYREHPIPSRDIMFSSETTFRTLCHACLKCRFARKPPSRKNRLFQIDFYVFFLKVHIKISCLPNFQNFRTYPRAEILDGESEKIGLMVTCQPFRLHVVRLELTSLLGEK